MSGVRGLQASSAKHFTDFASFFARRAVRQSCDGRTVGQDQGVLS
jgi:hypothetical protein